jgi:hypothetical protein
MGQKDDPNKKMSLREYRQYSEANHGKKALNDSMLRNMERATGGRNVSRAELDHLQAKIKIRQEGGK